MATQEELKELKNKICDVVANKSATQEELKELKNKICDVVANKSATKEDWFALWEEIERCRKTSDYKTWAKFYSTSVIEMVGMIVAGYEYDEQQEKEMKS